MILLELNQPSAQYVVLSWFHSTFGIGPYVPQSEITKSGIDFIDV